MKIYVLLVQGYEGNETICVSEDIKKIYESIEENKGIKDYLELEVWKHGEQIFCTTGSDVLKKVTEELVKSLTI